MKRLLLLGLVACGPNYDHTAVDNTLSQLPANEASIYRVVVVEGTAIKVHIESFDSNHDTMTADVVSGDSNVLIVTPTITEHDYLLQGLKSGRTEVRVTADGKLVLRIAALVEEQAP